MSNLKILTIEQLEMLAEHLDIGVEHDRVKTELANRKKLDKIITDELNNPPKNIMK